MALISFMFLSVDLQAMERQVEHFRNIPVMNRGLSERNVIGDSFDRRGRGQHSEPSP